MNIIFSSSENSEVVILDNLSLLNVSEENNIINNNELDKGKDLEGLTEETLKNNNKDSELEIITNYVIRKATEHKDLSYLLEKNLPHKVIYKHLVPSRCFFFFKLNMNLHSWLYVLGKVFCWLGLSSFCIVYFFVFCFFYSSFNKQQIEIDKDNVLLVYVFTEITMFITIMNGGLLGYKYGTIGNYDFFLNMILYPVVTYIFPILYSIIFFGFYYPEYRDYRASISYITDMVLYILLLLLMGITKLVNSFPFFIYWKKIQIIESFAKEYIINNSLDCNFIFTNFTFVGFMFALYLTSIISALGGIVKLIYTIVQLRKIFNFY